MKLHPTGNYLKAALYWLVAALFLAYQGVMAYRIVTTARWDPSYLPMLWVGLLIVAVALVMDVVLVVYPWVYLTHERRLRAAAQRDPTVTPPVSHQPPRELALRDGETLALTRIRRAGAIAASLARTVLIVLVLLFMGEFMLIALLPGLSHSVLNPLNDVAPLDPVIPLTGIAPLDWACAAFPPLASMLLALTMIYTTMHGQYDILVADDQGVSHMRSWGRRFIPWSDIHLFMRPLNTAGDAPAGGYLVWGQRHGFAFEIHGPNEGEVPRSGKNKKPKQTYRFEGGYEQYQLDARRLLATVCVRSYQPMVYWTETAKALAHVREWFPVAGLNEETARQLPVAAALQPGEAAVAAARLGPAPSFRLQARIRFTWSGLLLESLSYFVGLGVVGYIGSLSSGTALTPASIASGDPTAIIVLATIVPMFAAFAVLFALARRQGSFVTVSATGMKGSVSSGQSRKSKKPVEIPWGDIRAWAVIPAQPGAKRPTTYVVFGGGQVIRWVEPEGARLAGRRVRGDREAAFRERAAQLHALIVARTGLPLRDAVAAPDGAITVSMEALVAELEGGQA